MPQACLGISFLNLRYTLSAYIFKKKFMFERARADEGQRERGRERESEAVENLTAQSLTWGLNSLTVIMTQAKVGA